MIDYYVELFSRADMGAYVSLAMLGVVVVLALFGLLKGFSRGAGRQGVRLVTIAISAVLAFFATRSVYPVVVDFFEGKTMMDVFAIFGADGAVESANPELADLFTNMDANTVSTVAALPVTVFVLPIAFAALFVLISALMLLVHACVSGILGYTKSNNNFLTRLLGGAVGLVQGILVAAILLVPVSGFINFAAEATDRSESEDGAVTVLYQSYLEEAAHSPIHQLVTTYGGEQIYASLTTVSLAKDEEPVDTRESAYHLLSIIEKWETVNQADMQNLNDEQKAALDDIVNTLGEDPYLADILAGIVRTMMKSELVHGSIVGKFEEPFRSFFEEWLTVLETCSGETLKEDLSTIVDVMIILVDNKVFGAFEASDSEALRDILITTDENGDTVISRMVECFNRNPRTAHLVTTLARLSLTLMAGGDDLGLTEETLVKFNNVKEGLSEGVLSLDKESYGENTDAYVADVQSALDTTLTENGIALSEDVTLGMAQYISDNNELVADIDEMDDATLNKILINYYASYMQTVNP